MALFEKKTIINEIDYDKLAKAILKNQQKSEIDYEKLTDAIVKSQEIVEDCKQKKAEQTDENNYLEWRKKLGIKEYPENENFIKKLFHDICNIFKIYWSFMTFKNKDVNDDLITFNLMKMSLTAIFTTFQYFLYLIYLSTIIMAIMSDIVMWNYIIIASMSFVFAQLFRISEMEIEKIRDRNYLISILSAVTCFIAMIVAIISLFKG